MPFQAQFKHGDPLMVDHTPSGAAIVAGEVVVLVDTVRIAHRDIADGVLGALAQRGGVYLCAKTAGVVFADGDILYWDDTANSLNKTNTNKKFGVARGAALSAATSALAEHNPA